MSRGRGRERGSQADSTLSMEPDMGLGSASLPWVHDLSQNQESDA